MGTNQQSKLTKFISELSSTSGLNELYKRGYTPTQIKELIIKILYPYFENKDLLNDLAISLLVPEAVNVSMIKINSNFFFPLENTLLRYQSAKLKNQKACFEACSYWYNDTKISLTKFWSIKKLEHDIIELEIEEFVEECFANIGKVIEGLLKPFLKCLYSQELIVLGKKTSPKEIDSKSLGSIIQELSKNPAFFMILNPNPWAIPLNQWRNISYHHSFLLKGSEIICKYGKPSNLKVISLSREDLFKLLKNMLEIFRILKTAYVIFTVDNYQMMTYDLEEIPMRFEAKLVNFSSAIESQGFKILSITYGENESRMVLKDNTQMDVEKRMLHASQFVFRLWVLTKSRSLVVEYNNFNKKIKMIAQVDSETCKKIFESKIPFEKLAEIIKIDVFKMNDSNSNQSIISI